MWFTWLYQLLLEMSPSNLSRRKRLREFHLTGYPSLPLTLLVLCSVFSWVSCDEYVIPLGSEINAFGGGNNANWVSKNGVFSFGFLVMDGDDDVDGYAVGIQYNLGDKSVNFPVWTVGDGLRVSQNSILRLAMDGRLVLVDNLSKITMWSSDTSNLGVQKASLLGNGNFVLLGSEDEVIWESFGSPTDTLLPGQSLRYPLKLQVLSSKVVSSYYCLLISQSGELTLDWECNVTYWSSHFRSKEARFDSNGIFGLYDERDRPTWFVMPEDYRDPAVPLRHLRVDRDGNLRIYSWDSAGRAWKPVWQAVEDQCSVFGACGLYSVCSYNSMGPVCDCLNPVPSVGSGCMKMVDLGNCRMHTSVWTLNQTVLYGLYPYQEDELLLSETGCKDFCSNDTECFASTSMNDGSGRCIVKRTSFLTGYRDPYSHAVSFLKVCSVPQAVVAHGAGTGFGGPVAARERAKQLIGTIAFIVLLTVLAVLSVQILVFTILYRKRKVGVRSGILFGKEAQASADYSLLVRLSFEEVKDLTNCFADKIGTSVFRGVLANETPIVAKVLTDVAVTEKEFRSVVSTLGGIHHRNLAPVKGFCFEGSNKVLIREFVANRSLDGWLLDAGETRDGGKIFWEQKVEIALGIARGLAYLHSECRKCIAHGNLRPENVVFDENMVPKLTDFGLGDFLSRQGPSSSESPTERDIYELGLMLVQILTCKRDVEGENMEKLLERVKQDWKFLDGDDLEAMERMGRISFWCMQRQPFLRPSIREVVKVLEGTLSVDRPPSFLTSRQDVRVEMEILEAECQGEAGMDEV